MGSGNYLEQAVTYLPQDRRAALAQGRPLPDRTQGSALFADVSGLAHLEEILEQSLEPQQVSLTLISLLDRVIGALISEVERHGGSVINFAGNSIICWFDNQYNWFKKQPGLFGEELSAQNLRTVLFRSSALRATACAVAMPAAVQAELQHEHAVELPVEFTLRPQVKVVVASGPARRFVVGDPTVQLFDILGGETLGRMESGIPLAQPGELFVDKATLDDLPKTVKAVDWRSDNRTGSRFAVLSGAETISQTDMRSGELPLLYPQQVRPWLLPAIWNRLEGGSGEYAAGMRPVAALFLKLVGIDYNHDDNAGVKLDEWIRRAQEIIQAYSGSLLQLTLGDDDANFYACFGAPLSRDDDTRRAVYAALELRRAATLLGLNVHIGISQGNAYIGTYGSCTRRTFSVLGANIAQAAQLMDHAAPGEILVSAKVQEAGATVFNFAAHEALPLNGVPKLLTAYTVTGVLKKRAIRLQEPTYALPMIGRQMELKTIQEKMNKVMQGQGQVIGITAEAGMGKSRLMAEAIRMARRKGFIGFGGACQPSGKNMSYLVWKPICQAFFDIDVDTDVPPQKHARQLEEEIAGLAPERLQAVPLLGMVLDLALPENDFTRTLSPQFRKSVLEATLIDCLRTAANRVADEKTGILIVLEDMHWIDPASFDLLMQIARTIVDLPVLVMMAYRPMKTTRDTEPEIENLPHFTRIGLNDLTEPEVEQIIRGKLAQLIPDRGRTMPHALIQRFNAESQGNPFYLEELLSYLYEHGIDPYDAHAVRAVDLPTNLQDLVLSRIDQLTEKQQMTLRAASVLGRVFRYDHLLGAYPYLGDCETLKTNLQTLSRLDLTPSEAPEPELSFLFKHIVTLDVAYESLPPATRAGLHERYAQFIEQKAGEQVEAYYDLLAFHYDRSDNLEKKRCYLHRASESAIAKYANREAEDYLSRALKLCPSDELQDRYGLLLLYEHVHDMLGKRGAQGQDVQALEELAQSLGTARVAEVSLRRARFEHHSGRPEREKAAAETAISCAREMKNIAIEAEGHLEYGKALLIMNDFTDMFQHFKDGLALAEQGGLSRVKSEILEKISVGYHFLYDFLQMIYYGQQGLEVARASGNRQSECEHLMNISYAYILKRDYSEALRYGHECLRLSREISNLDAQALSYIRLAHICWVTGQYAAGEKYSKRSLQINIEAGKVYDQSVDLMYLGHIECERKEYQAAAAHLSQSIQMAHEMSSGHIESYSLSGLGLVRLAEGNYAEARDLFRQAKVIRIELGQKGMAMQQQAYIAMAALAENKLTEAMDAIQEVLAYIEANSMLWGADFPFAVYLVCTKVLRASGFRRRADVLLEQGYEAMMEIANCITDVDMHRSYLEDIAWHRDLLAVWKAQ